MLDDAADRPQPDLTRHLRVVALGHELVLVAFPQRDVVVTPVRRHPHERLRHEARERVEFPPDLATDLPVGGEPVGRLVGMIEVEVQLELAGRVLVVALDHVEVHRLAVLHDLVDQRLQLGELIDVVAVRLRLALDGGLAVGVDLQPHHLGLGAGSKVQTGVFGELRVDALEVAPAVRREERAAVDFLFPPAEQRAPHTGGLGIPRQDVEGLGFGDPDQLACFRPVADVIAVAVGEQVGGGPVHQLEAGVRDALPVGGGDALAHDATRHRDELVVHVLDALFDDLALHRLDRLGAAGLRHEPLEIAGHRSPLPLRAWRRHPADRPRTGARTPIVRGTISACEPVRLAHNRVAVAVTGTCCPPHVVATDGMCTVAITRHVAPFDGDEPEA